MRRISTVCAAILTGFFVFMGVAGAHVPSVVLAEQDMELDGRNIAFLNKRIFKEHKGIEVVPYASVAIAFGKDSAGRAKFIHTSGSLEELAKNELATSGDVEAIYLIAGKDVDASSIDGNAAVAPITVVHPDNPSGRLESIYAVVSHENDGVVLYIAYIGEEVFGYHRIVTE